MPTDDFIPLWFRPLRQLLDEGKPVGPMSMLWIGEDDKTAMPLGCSAWTSKNRLIFWPNMPPKIQVVSGNLTNPIDHITLEFPSTKMHATWYDEAGRRQHDSQEWRLHEFGDSGLALWFQLFVRWSVLDEQDRVVERQVLVPNSDAKRREAEFVRFAQNLRHDQIQVPPRNAAGNFLLCSIYVVTAVRQRYELTPDMLPLAGVDNHVDGWPDGPFVAVGTGCDVGDKKLLVACACPPGELQDALRIGFPIAAPRRSAG